MSLKTFLLGRMNKVFTRADLPPRHAALHTVGDAGVALGEPPPARGRSSRVSITSARTGRWSAPFAKSSSASLQATCACILRSPSAIATC